MKKVLFRLAAVTIEYDFDHALTIDLHSAKHLDIAGHSAEREGTNSLRHPLRQGRILVVLLLVELL